MCPWISKFIRSITSKWNLEVTENNKILFNKRVKRGILQGDSLSPLLFVLCLEPLSKKLNGIYPKIEIGIDDKNFASNHLLFIDDLKLLSKTEDVLKEMIAETKQFFKTVGLEMNKDKSATNAKSCTDDTRLLENQEGYKYLGLSESAKVKTSEENTEIILKEIERRVESLCKSKLNGRNLSTAINQHALSLINYYVGILNIEPNMYKEFDERVRIILIKP